MMTNKAGFLICSLSFLILACLPADLRRSSGNENAGKNTGWTLRNNLEVAGAAEDDRGRTGPR